jgi:hypothetical protein
VCKRKFKLLKSRKQSDHVFLGILLVVVFLLFSGCARKYPATLALDAEQEQYAHSLLQKIRKQDSPDYLDADVTVSWMGYGRKFNFDATLQATRAGRFRLGGLDPLGRPFFILVTDGTTFTLVDNRQGRGYTGAVDSAFFRRYIPSGVRLTTCFSLLTAQLPDTEVRKTRVAENKESYWFIFAGRDGLRRRAGIDSDTGFLARQILVDAENEIVLDVRYHDYQSQTALFYLPRHMYMESEKMPGSLRITLNRVYREKPLPDSIFTLHIPEHFSVVQVR